MNIADLLIIDRISCDHEATSKKKALEALSALLASETPDTSQDEIFDSLISRERLGSTGLGHGVALPHARLPGQEKAIGAFVKLTQGVDFDAIDGLPTDLLFSLLVPDHFTDEHLNILAKLAEMFSDKDFCKQLRDSADSQQLLNLISQYQASSAA